MVGCLNSGGLNGGSWVIWGVLLIFVGTRGPKVQGAWFLVVSIWGGPFSYSV